MTATIKIENADALRHPLAPLICAAVGFPAGEPTYIDAEPGMEFLVIRVAADAPPSDAQGGGFYSHHSVDTQTTDDGQTHEQTLLFYEVPAPLAVVMFKLQQTAEGVDNGETWQDVLDHICQRSVWKPEGATDDEDEREDSEANRQWHAAMRLAVMSHPYFRQAEKAAAAAAAASAQ